MPSLNKVFLMGNLTRDPDLRYTPAGMAIAVLNLAVNTMIGRDEDGKPKEDTLFVDVVVFGRQAESTNEYLKKGSLILVEGRLRYRSWEDANGNRHSKHEVVSSRIQFLTTKSRSDENGVSDYIPDEDEDVPF